MARVPLDSSGKPLLSFSATQVRQEVNEQYIKFHFATKERQRRLNFGKKIDPEQDQQRHKQVYSRMVKLNMTKREFFSLKIMAGFDVNLHPVVDSYSRFVFPTDPRYYDIKPITATFTVSEKSPGVLEQWNAQDLDHYLTTLLSKWIIGEINPNKITSKSKDWYGYKNILFQSLNFLVINEKLGMDNLNKNAFNVFAAKYFQHEINFMNRRLEIMGYPKIKESEALFKTEKTINKPSYYIYEYGEV